MRILSVSSHVAFGHVGNAALVFPLQRLGVEVLPVMTTQLSNHLGYGRAKGGAVSAERVAAVLAGLAELDNIGAIDGLITGYLADAATGEALAAFVPRFKAAHPGAPYLLDPVMGDEGRLYVHPDLATVVRERLVPLADLATPNPFELGVLTGLPTDDEAAILRAARTLIARGPKAVLVTSVSRGDRIGALLVTADASTAFLTPRLDFAIAPNGAGDLVAGLFLVEYRRSGDLAVAARLALARLWALLQVTRERGGRELALVAGQEALAAADPATVTVE